MQHSTCINNVNTPFIAQHPPPLLPHIPINHHRRTTAEDHGLSASPCLTWAGVLGRELPMMTNLPPAPPAVVAVLVADAGELLTMMVR